MLGADISGMKVLGNKREPNEWTAGSFDQMWSIEVSPKGTGLYLD